MGAGREDASQPKMQKVTAKKQIIKVLVADDHPVVRKGAADLLRPAGKNEGCGRGRGRRRSSAQGARTVPRRRSAGHQHARHERLWRSPRCFAKKRPQSKSLFCRCTATKTPSSEVIQAGAHGYVSKEAPAGGCCAPSNQCMPAIPFFSEEVARAEPWAEFVKEWRKEEEPFSQLTSREHTGSGP